MTRRGLPIDLYIKQLEMLVEELINELEEKKCTCQK